MDTLYFILQRVFIAFIPLLIVAIGGLITEKSGVTNIALEGLMVIGAFAGAVVIRTLQSTSMDNQLIYLIGMLVGGLVGMLFSIFHAVAAIRFKADQIISATALNISMVALSIFIARIMSGGGGKSIQFLEAILPISEVPLLSSIPFIGDIFFKEAYISNFIGFGIFFVVWIMLQKTKFGKHLQSVGENPHAAQSVGINIFKIRYIAVLASGFLAGLGGVVFVVTTAGSFEATVAGFGFLAISVLIFGNWSAPKILLATYFFAFVRTINQVKSLIPWLRDLPIHSHIYNMLPYIVVMIVLVFFSKRSRAPKAVGKIFDQGQR